MHFILFIGLALSESLNANLFYIQNIQHACNPKTCNHKTKKSGVLYKNCNSNTKTRHFHAPRTSTDPRTNLNMPTWSIHFD